MIENTSSAFAAAIAGGYGIECDVQLSRDGEAMVHHDEALGRLTEGQARLADALGKVTGRTVTVNARVDPAIVGGVVARVGSLVFDGSVVRQIERLRERLLADA